MTRAQLARRYREAWQRIEDPKHWCQGTYARCADGDEAYCGSALAVRWCALGSAMLSNLNIAPLAVAALMLCKGCPWHCESVAEFNDNRGHDAVREMYALAIHLIKAGHFDHLCEEENARSSAVTARKKGLMNRWPSGWWILGVPLFVGAVVVVYVLARTLGRMLR
jgi:hypothetical protein